LTKIIIDGGQGTIQIERQAEEGEKGQEGKEREEGKEAQIRTIG
jgi:hypothetical protein